MKVTAVILIGGSNSTTAFRPLSLDLPKPLFPVAGREILYHHVKACSKLKSLHEIIMIGHYDEGLFSRFFAKVERELLVSIRYMRETQPSGTAGGIRMFKAEILKGEPTHVVVMHHDICSTFPLSEMIQFHIKHGQLATLLGKRVLAEELSNYGCIVAHSKTREVLHWAEKPETFVSDTINCGVYVFSSEIMDVITEVGDKAAMQKLKSDQELTVSDDVASFYKESQSSDKLQMEQDILMPLAGQGKVFLYETGDIWMQIRTPGAALICSELYMQRYRLTDPTFLASNGGKLMPTIEGNVIIDPSCQVHASAKLGPNVTIGAGCQIGAGVRIAHAIILEGTIIKDRACIMFSIIGWNSTIGQWTRIEGQPPGKAKQLERGLNIPRDITIFGVSVKARSEIIIRNCIVLPHKVLSQSYHNEILL